MPCRKTLHKYLNPRNYKLLLMSEITSNMELSHPYDELTPDCILNAIESTGLVCDGRLFSLNSYENRVYQIGLDESITVPISDELQNVVIAKFYRPHRWSTEAIQEEHALVESLHEREIPVIAPLHLTQSGIKDDEKTLHEFNGFRFAIYPRCIGRSPEFDHPDVFRWMGRFIARIHAVGSLEGFAHRPKLDITSFGTDPKDWLLDHHFIPDDIEKAWQSVVEQALEGVQRCYERAGKIDLIRLHGDCYAGNVIWKEDDNSPGPHFVDFDDSRMGPAIQDLWMLLSGNENSMSRQFTELMNGYREFFDFNPNELYLIEALRTLRLLHYSAWLAKRWSDPAFPLAFPWFNTQRYWQDRILELREQISLMNEAPLQIENV